MNFDPEPDLHPLYPTAAQLSSLLASDSGLDPGQKAELVKHCLKRASLFGDLSLAQFLIRDIQAQTYVDLSTKDEDGVGLVSLTIHVFGGDLDRDIEREECVRFLVSQGADLGPDKAGWTPLHHAALLAPPTLVSYLMTHGCSPFDVTEKNLTPLDLITAHSVVPGREDVAMLLEEAMRGEGWTGGRMEQKRRLHERLSKRKGKQKAIRDDVTKLLGVNPRWWTSDENDSGSDSDDDDAVGEDVFVISKTPPADYSSMLVFNPIALPQIFDTLITNYPISLKDPTPANTLYMLARFACLTCDHTWLEDLIMGAADTIEEAFFNNADDLTSLIFWLHNTTLWLHLMQCDTSISEACEMLGSFELIEEVINSVFVFIIRFAERRIDQLLDSSLLDYAPQGSDSETVQFESEWSFLRPFTKKKAPPPVGVGHPSNSKNLLASPEPTALPRSPPSMPKFSSLKQTIARAQATTRGTPLAPMFSDTASNPSPYELTSFLTALQTLLVFADINPMFTTQLWSQVFYWSSCEVFNRVITRKKYLCRSRAVQILANLAVVEEWVDELGIPPGVLSHFAPVKDLLGWTQCLSSLTDFAELVAVIQSLKALNPLQMRRAVRDYKYEVNENKMTEECIQYITQLQKDWERHRVKLGVEALRKEISERDRDRDDSSSTIMSGSANGDDRASIMSAMSTETGPNRQSIDLLFDREQEITTWAPPKPPQVLGELLDSRYMLPLLFPSDPRLLAALPSKTFLEGVAPTSTTGRGSIDFGNRGLGPLTWRSRNRKIREAGVGVLQWVDGLHSAARWWRPTDHTAYEAEEEEEEHRITEEPEGYSDDEGRDAEDPDDPEAQDKTLRVTTQLTPFTRKPSYRSKGGRPSLGDVTPIDASYEAKS
ncbi:DIL domain-containing protein [Ephemerocybe angulata]|uniref:DIL domain-containing protein n=1 Tax=Ephemerocybe angulata TaxID=980116 RepID=A0A8H6IIM3_9AGAR|nr:DIL domain-containing protein [Tulosesus angulatus]